MVDAVAAQRVDLADMRAVGACRLLMFAHPGDRLALLATAGAQFIVEPVAMFALIIR